MRKIRLVALLLLVIGIGLGYLLFNTQTTKPFTLGLDLSGGTYLEYTADVSAVPEAEQRDSLAALRDVVERRVNLFGISEPNVQTQTINFDGQEGKQYRLTVELPGVTDVNEAISTIGQTPLLEFKLDDPNYQPPAIEATTDEDGNLVLPPIDPFERFVDTGLTGQYLKRASVQFTQGVQSGTGGFSGEPYIALTFDKEGADLFGDITTENIGRTLAIFLDGTPISTPTIQSAIPNGEAIITGVFTPVEARELVGRLNAGALPIPIELASTQTIGPTLGADAADAGVFAGLIGFAVVALFLLVWYRLSGLVAVVALAIYSITMLAVFKFLPVTLTAAGIAGFIMSLGIAVDANILIFERLQEELKKGQSLFDGLQTGFSRAWPSIRDANISSIISAVILFWFGSSLIKGFALTFGLGVLISMLSAVVVSRSFVLALAGKKTTKTKKALFMAGFSKTNSKA